VLRTAAAAPETPASAQTARSRITEIIPPASYGAPGSPPAFALKQPARPKRDGANAQASAEPCVDVFVRSAKVDGREVASVDLHGDGLIKGAVPPHLAGALLARAGPASDPDGARAACVSPALAESLFNPVINVAAVDPAVRIARVGDRWALAGSREPQPVAEAQAPVQLAVATRGATKPTAKNEGAPAVVTTRVEQAKPGSAGTTSQSAPEPASTSAQQVVRVTSP
jgi:hypothetical protein